MDPLMDAVWASIGEQIPLLLTAPLIALLSSWLTVRLSISKFRSQHWWEKEVEAYGRVVDALHLVKRYADEILRSLLLKREIGEARVVQLTEDWRRARDDLARARDAGRLLMSSEAVRLLADYEEAIDRLHDDESQFLQDLVEMESILTDTCLRKFIRQAKSDLKIKGTGPIARLALRKKEGPD
jgi:hypothetical protein